MNSSLSICIPTYNQGHFIEETLESLLNQTREPFEIVVSDNHCTDDTPEVLEKYRDRIRIVKPPEHLPTTTSWNYAVSQSTGSWFVLMSSDDLALPNFVETLERGTRISEKAVLVRAGYQFIDAGGRVLSTVLYEDLPTVVSPPNTLIDELDNQRVLLCAAAVRKSAWKTVGGFPEQCHVLGDRGLWMLLSPIGDYIYQDKTVSQYRICYRDRESEKRNSPLLTEDEIYLDKEVLPDLIQKISPAKEVDIRDVVRRRCRYRLVTESRILGPTGRGEVADIINDWAIECGCKKQLEAFRKGKKVYRKPYGLFRRTISQCAGMVRDLGRTARAKFGYYEYRPRIRAF